MQGREFFQTIYYLIKQARENHVSSSGKLQLKFFTQPPIFLLINFTILVVNGRKIVTTRTKKKRKIDLEILPSLLARTSKAVTSGSFFDHAVANKRLY